MTPAPRLIPQAGPPVWNAAALTPADWMLPLGAEAAAELASAVAALDGKRPLRAEEVPLPNLAPLLRQLAERLETGRGFALLRGLPLDRLEAGGLEAALLALAAHLGTPLPQEAGGSLVATPPAETEEAETAHFHADPADAVGLLCLRQEKAGGSISLISAAALHNALLKADRAALAVLHQPLPHRVPGTAEGGFARRDLPIFASAGGAFHGRYDRAAIPLGELTPEQRAALAALDEAAAAPGQALNLALHPGDLLFYSPTLVWKRRGTQEDRQLLRLWLSRPEGRPLPEAFRALRGNGAALGTPGMVGG